MAILDSGTIVAVATAEGRGGLAVVRLSGPEALAIAGRILPDTTLAEPVTSHLARLATVHWPDGGPDHHGLDAGTNLDQVLVLPMLAPNSFTGEDTVEFSCHGGALPARQVAAACRAAGARAAGPGEFSRRAFLNGRLTLDQAEAVADLIDAEHSVGARAALSQLRGSLDRELTSIENPLRTLLARLEGAMEFSEDEADVPAPESVHAVLGEARDRITGLLDLVPAGRHLRDGVQVVLVGPPNVGKSSLMNALLDRPRAIVDSEPGTTRDVVTDRLELDGLLFVLHDTAGVHEAATGVEAQGVVRTRDALTRADIVLAVATSTDAADDVAFPEAAEGSIMIPVLTKGDLFAGDTGAGLVTSAVTGQGLDELKRVLVEVALAGGLAEATARGLVLNDRHQDRLLACRDSLDELISADGAGDEVVASLLAVTLQELGAISGRVFTEKLLDELFGRFCVGK